MVDNNRSCRVCQNSGEQNNQNGNCGCNNNNGGSNNQRSLMRRLQMVDFAIVETVLYLNAYPECKAALSYYNKLLAERERLADSLARSGKPITNMNNADTESWNWTNGPWPWELDAN